MYVHTNMHTGREARKNKDQNIPQDDQEVTKIVRVLQTCCFLPAHPSYEVRDADHMLKLLGDKGNARQGCMHFVPSNNVI